MISAISGYNPSAYGLYGSYYANRTAQTLGANKAAQAAEKAQRGMVSTAQKVHQPDTPVQPVPPVRPVSSEEDPAQSGLLRFQSDPAEMAVRMRIQHPDDASAAQQDAAQAVSLPGAKEDAAQAVSLPGAKSAQDANSPLPSETSAVSESKSAQEVMEEGECETCKERKYQDGSDDPGVSFKTPTHIAPDQAAAAVRGHENEHVVREQAKAQQEDRKVVSQSVTYHTDICPECGKTYVSGGTTRTVTKANTDNQAQQQAQNQTQNQKQQDPRSPIPVLA